MGDENGLPEFVVEESGEFGIEQWGDEFRVSGWMPGEEVSATIEADDLLEAMDAGLELLETIGMVRLLGLARHTAEGMRESLCSERPTRTGGPLRVLPWLWRKLRRKE